MTTTEFAHTPSTDGTARVPLPTGARRGAVYLESLDDQREIWCDGRRVDVTRDAKFRPMADTLARLFDHQHAPENASQMLYTSPTSNNKVSLSYLAPSTPEDLTRKWNNSRQWAAASHGQLSRLPDFTANVAVGLYDFRHELAKVDDQFGQRASDYYHYCRERDVVLSHGLGDPQIDRSSTPIERPELGLQVVERSADGIVVRGAKNIATLAPFANEMLIYLSPANYLRSDPKYVCWFALPLATPGLRVLCRSAYANESGLGDRFDEQDSMLIFDDVFIPANRVFLLDDASTAARGFHEINKWSLFTGQIRFHYRLSTMLGLASLLAQAIGVDKFREVQTALGELTSYVEVLRLGIDALGRETRRTGSDLLTPGSTGPLDALAGHFSARASEIIRQIGASGLIIVPTENDLATPDLSAVIETYMCGRDIGAAEKSALFRLASKMVVDRFGMRQELYESLNRGDPARVRATLYTNFPGLQACEAQVNRLLQNDCGTP